MIFNFASSIPIPDNFVVGSFENAINATFLNNVSQYINSMC